MPEHEDLRRDVATANRILERVGLSNAFGHASARIPGTETFLMPTRRSPGLCEAQELVTQVLGLGARQYPADDGIAVGVEALDDVGRQWARTVGP